MTAFSELVVKILKEIPRGKVATYGQIARLAGNPRGARGVVYILRSHSKKKDLPWHRVVGKSGEIRIKDAEGFQVQKRLLEDEGVKVSDTGKIKMSDYVWKP